MSAPLSLKFCVPCSFAVAQVAQMAQTRTPPRETPLFRLCHLQNNVVAQGGTGWHRVAQTIRTAPQGHQARHKPLDGAPRVTATLATPLHISGAGLAARQSRRSRRARRGFFTSLWAWCCVAWSAFNGGPCGEGATPAGTYSRSANPARSAAPSLGREVRQVHHLSSRSHHG